MYKNDTTTYLRPDPLAPTLRLNWVPLSSLSRLGFQSLSSTQPFYLDLNRIFKVSSSENDLSYL